MTLPVLGNAGLMAMLTLLIACASEPSSDSACVPGKSEQCTGTNGCSGSQTCAADGASFESCLCANLSGGTASKLGGTPSTATGGRAQGLGGSGGSGGARTVTATGGQQGIGSGGTTSTSTTCKPSDMNGFAYPAYVPARQLRGSCTEQAIRQYYTDCINNDSCAAYLPGGAEAKCGACLNPSELGSQSYGPLLKAGTTWFYFYEVNVSGCQELVGEVECAPKIQVEFLCRFNSCSSNCPLANFADFDPLMQCMNQADTQTCTAENAAANCLKDQNNTYSCWGSGFQSQFLAVARVFCL